MPIASLESVMGRQALLPFLEADAVDVCIVDPLWNGVDESCKMAALCDVFEGVDDKDCFKIRMQ